MFKDRLRELRKNRNMTQSAIAKIAEITDRAVRKLEAGVSEPSLATLLALARFFGVSIDYLVGETDDPTPPLVGSAATRWSTAANLTVGRSDEPAS